MNKYIEGQKYNIDGIEYEYVNIGKITLGSYNRILIMKFIIYLYNNIEDKSLRKEIENFGKKQIITLTKYCEKIYCYDLNKLSDDDIYNRKKNIIEYFNKIINYEYFKEIVEPLKSLYFYIIYIKK